MIGISTYAYLWRRDSQSTHPVSITDMLNDAARLGAGVVQICDAVELEEADYSWLKRTQEQAQARSVNIETGTRGTSAEHLREHLVKAVALGARFVRTMVGHPGAAADLLSAEKELRAVLPAFTDSEVTLGLETYEQVGTDELVSIIEEIGSPSLGICLDVSNVIARLENPDETAMAAAPYTVNMHVKDFAFTRRDNQLGFTLTGARLGRGLLQFDHIKELLWRNGKDVNFIIEHWLQFGASLEDTCETERDWVEASVGWLRQHGC